MAVKQNNTDSSGVPQSPNDNKPNGSNGSTSSAANMVNMGSNGVMVGGSMVADPQKKKSNIKAIGMHIDSLACGSNMDVINVQKNDKVVWNEINNIHEISNSNSDIACILNFIDEVQDKRKQVSQSEWLWIYQSILQKLSRVHLKRKCIEDFKQFKEDIRKIGDFFENTSDQAHYLFYLRIVCQIVMQTDTPTPSCAIAIIFQLFSDDMIYDAVESLLDINYPNQNIKQIVHVLCDWMHVCTTFCPNLNAWIFRILEGLQTRKKYELFDEICIENIDTLFVLLMVPIFRPKVAPIVFHMLTNTQHIRVFRKILPKFFKIILSLQQQVNTHEEAKQTLKQLINITRKLLERFHCYDAMYEPVIELIKDIRAQTHFEDSTDELIDVDQHKKNIKVGLVNLGNTCYMNSVLQALAMTKEFAREIIMYQCASPLIIKIRQQIALMLYSQRCELTPSRVLNATRPPGFAPGLQQDSSEFLGYLLETLHEQDVSTRKVQLKKLVETNDAEKHIEPMAKSAKQENKSDAIVSTVDKIFTGKLATTYKCLTCGWGSRNVDSFRDLQLSFPEVENDCVSNYSVQDLIDYYCSPEKLDGDNQYFCERCKKLSDAERLINVITAPKNLILTLKHFKYDQKYHMRAKLMHKVFHDEKITVKECAVETLNEVNIVHYDLYAGVVHSGFSMDSGHYYTYASDATNEWYKFNDNIVTSSKSEELHNLTPPNTPYILFYQMCARSCPEIETSSELLKIESPLPLKVDELPPDLRDYINHDNCLFAEEVRVRRLKATNDSLLRKGDTPGRRYNSYDDDDNDPPPAGGGCGGSALNVNVNRFVY